MDVSQLFNEDCFMENEPFWDSREIFYGPFVLMKTRLQHAWFQDAYIIPASENAIGIQPVIYDKHGLNSLYGNK